MASRFSWGMLALTAMILVTPFISANDMLGPHHHHRGCNKCQVVEEIVYQDVVVQRCRMVPDNKPIKKTVYEVKEVPYCQKKLPGFGQCEDCCRECECCARTKKVLIKKEIICGEKEGTKCVTEDVIERVPVKVQRVIPCAACQSSCQCQECQAARMPVLPSVEVVPTRTAGLPKVKTSVAPVHIEDPSAPPVPVPSLR